ncbi:hypothetical protein H0H92_006610 [Tricholoma furcatifolium]|nr:hypothetical protein H0H92_006610 [Tricholoma furcatifolium]
MEIPKLWNLISPAAESTTLKQLAVNQGFVDNIGGIHAIRLGIDASAWLCQVRFHHGNTRHPELVALFARLVELLQLPVAPYFVFDGNERPKVKRGKRVGANPHWLEDEFKELLSCFSFDWITAPGEAEAELSCMSKEGIVDAVETEDSDIFVFGAKTVLRRAATLLSHPDLQLGSADFVVIALLAGGDYSDGIVGCGVDIAASLAHSGLGTALIQAAEGGSVSLRVGRDRLVHELRTNSSGFLKRKHVALANSIPEIFPDLTILNLYLHPVTTTSKNIERPPLLPACNVDLRRLAKYSATRFTWASSPDSVYHYFSTTVLPGLVIQALVAGARSGTPTTLLDHIITVRPLQATPPPPLTKDNIAYSRTPLFMGKIHGHAHRRWACP